MIIRIVGLATSLVTSLLTKTSWHKCINISFNCSNMKFVELLLEIFGWLQIVAGVTFGAGLIALFIYLKWSSNTGEIAAIIIASVGFIFGCIWATRIWKRHGTINWLCRIRKIF